MTREKLQTLKEQILEDAANPLRKELELVLRDRKTFRVILLVFVTYVTLFAFSAFLIPLLSSKEFAMPVYLQLPWTKLVGILFKSTSDFNQYFFKSLNSHPSYEINFAALSCYALLTSSFLCGALKIGRNSSKYLMFSFNFHSFRWLLYDDHTSLRNRIESLLSLCRKTCRF